MTSRVGLALFLLTLVGCSHDAAPPPVADARPAAVRETHDSRPAIVIFGDSLSAGFGLDPGESYPDHLQELLDGKGYQYHVINQGLSGDTTTGGLSRIEECVAEKPTIVLVELGGNDGLRGTPVAITRANLEKIIERIQSTGAQAVLAGITLPRNYGDEYIKEFDRIYPELAAKYNVPLIPFLLEGLASPSGMAPGMIQPDGIHPTAKGTPVIARTVLAKLVPLLKTK